MSSPAEGEVAVSVIVPVYNPGKYLEACVDSLLGQSLPNQSYEVIFVDDGSTDESSARLDEVASKESNVRVLHEAASGWSGRPRNIGIDHALGQYVYFCDHDDWLAPEALERLMSFADDAGADVVIGKMIGHQRDVPRRLFRENDPAATLWSKPLMTSLSPHKLFRRGFLNEHGLRFPVGEHRLGDHLFVVQAYFLAAKVAVLSDYVCYHHVRRDDGSGAAHSLVDPAVYFGYVRELIDVIEAQTEPGPERDQVLERPFTHEMLAPLARPRRSAPPAGYPQAMFTEVRTLMLERFAPDYADRLPFLNRVQAAAVRAGQFDGLVDLNQRVKTLRGRATLGSLRWDGGRWLAEIEVEALFTDGSPMQFAPLGDTRWSVDDRLLPAELQASQHLSTEELLGGRAEVIALERATDEEWYVPCGFSAELRDLPGEAGPHQRLVMNGTAQLDQATLAGGRALPNGLWDVSVRFVVAGVELQARLGADAATLPLPSAAIVGPRPVTVIPYLTENRAKLTLDIGQRLHTLLATFLARPVGPVAVTRDNVIAPVDVDIAPGASPRPLRLHLHAGDRVVGHLEAAIVAGAAGAELRAGTVPKPARGGGHIEYGAGRYTLGAQSRAKDKPMYLGVVDLDRRGRIIAADFDPSQRAAVVPLPHRFGSPTAAQQAYRKLRHEASRLKPGS